MSFTRVKAQERAHRILAALLSAERLPPALLFCGPEGVGKQLLAKEFCSALLCPDAREAAACGRCPSCRAAAQGVHPDLKLVDAAYQAGLEEEDPAKQRTLKVDTVRHLRRDMELAPLLGGWKAAIIQEAHTLEIEAANALLKILEEPPEKTLWILLTSQKERLPRTVLSRCFTVPFAPLPDDALEQVLLEHALPPEQARELSRLCEGSASRALQLAAEPDLLGSLRAGPPAAAQAAAKLDAPRDLARARIQAELALYALAQDLRRRGLGGGYPGVEEPLRRLQDLRAALRANADPRSILLLAGLEAARKAR